MWFFLDKIRILLIERLSRDFPALLVADFVLSIDSLLGPGASDLL
jgi:hypothetical protein